MCHQCDLRVKLGSPQCLFTCSSQPWPRSIPASPWPPPCPSPGSASGRNGALILPGLFQAAFGARNQEMLLASDIRHNLQGGQSPTSSLGPAEIPPGACGAFPEVQEVIPVQDVSWTCSPGPAGGTLWFPKESLCEKL